MSSLQIWSFVMVGLTFALYIGIAIWSRAKSTSDFYVAGGGVSPLANGMATAADWMSAASFISMAGLISFMGYDGGVYLMGWTGGYVLCWLYFWPLICESLGNLRFRILSERGMPARIGRILTGPRLVAVICALFVSFTYVVGTNERGRSSFFTLSGGRVLIVGVFIGIGIVFLLCGSGRNERNYLYAGCSVLRSHLRLHGASHIHLYSNYK